MASAAWPDASLGSPGLSASREEPGFWCVRLLIPHAAGFPESRSLPGRWAGLCRKEHQAVSLWSLPLKSLGTMRNFLGHCLPFQLRWALCCRPHLYLWETCVLVINPRIQKKG